MDATTKAIKHPTLADETVRNIVSTLLATLRAELRALGFDFPETAFADLANTIRPLLNLALRFDVERALIVDHRTTDPTL